MTDFITDNTIISGLIGFIAPALIPVIFGWIAKATKKEITNAQKKVVILVLAMGVALLVICFNYTWTAFSWAAVKEFLITLMTNYIVVLGMVNTVYTMIVKLFPAIDQKLELVEKIIRK